MNDIFITLTIKEVRQEKGMSQMQLSNKSNVSRGYIAELKNNLKSPTIDILCKLARALKCEPEDLYIFN